MGFCPCYAYYSLGAILSGTLSYVLGFYAYKKLTALRTKKPTESPAKDA